ncbi:MAG: hypothetical protein K2O31_01580 [Clostridia bacterium]|nr:hypothetical protein [Clostridia bacterium]MDE6869808.1 hypothetical protein [Clostridia bacterium]MDE7208551.1 hypothetical protein [Clostridia bacterium]
MGFTKRQKIALIISLWLYFLWIVSISSIMRAQFKGKLINCIIVGGIGCAVVFALYLIVFSGAYYVPKKITRKENIQKIKIIYRSENIWAIYISIVGFFLLSLSVLLLDQNKIYSGRLAWLITISSLFFIAIVILCLDSYRRLRSAIRTFELQEKNDGILKVENCSDEIK